MFLQGLWFVVLRLRRPESRAHAARRARQPWQLPLRMALSPAARQASLALLLKFFFAPLMINWCLNHVADMAGAVVQLIDGAQEGQAGRALFDASLFWAVFQCILFVDTLLFTLGYIVEVPALSNRIRSVDPTFFGWFVCLACYPPFNDFTGRFLHGSPATFRISRTATPHFAPMSRCWSRWPSTPGRRSRWGSRRATSPIAAS